MCTPSAPPALFGSELSLQRPLSFVDFPTKIRIEILLKAVAWSNATHDLKAPFVKGRLEG